ncbi:MAG: hypothetical protein ACOC1V_06850 [Candidatus Saliniplasma sp.]
MSDKTVRIFYSSTTEPELLVFYSDGISYLQDSEVDVQIIDITKEPEKAREFDVPTTPYVSVEKGGEIHQEYGVAGYFSGSLGKEQVKKLLEEEE